MKYTGGIKFVSPLEATGGGLAAIAYVRGLVNAGVPLQWLPLVQRGVHWVPLEAGASAPLAALSIDDVSLSDLATLIAATQRPVNSESVLVHSAPEHWRSCFEPGKRNIGFTGWSADRLPPHWEPLLNQAQAIFVPSETSRQALLRAGLRPAVRPLPRIRRQHWNRFEPAELRDFRQTLAIPPDHFVFYTIASWEPRQNLPALLRAFAQAFSVDDPVSLVIKTGPTGHDGPPFYHRGATAQLAARALEAVSAELGRPPPSICMLPYELSGRGIDLLHTLGDGYVSLAHGETWGSAAFDAASRGTPVIMTGWGGQQTYLGPSWRGALPFQLSEVPVFPPMNPVFWPPQRWAVPDLEAAAGSMKSLVHDPATWRREAAATQASIHQRFAEPVVIRQLLALLADA